MRNGRPSQARYRQLSVVRDLAKSHLDQLAGNREACHGCALRFPLTPMNGEGDVTGQQSPAGWYSDPSGAGGQKYWDGQQWIDTPNPAAPKPQGFSRKTGFIILGVVAALVLMAIIGVLGGGGDDSDSTASSTSSPSVPAYRLEVGEKPSTLNVYVPKLPTAGETSLIVEDLQDQYSTQDDGYFVQIFCEESGQFESGNRLANARFAVGNIGAARTGLNDGEKKIDAVVGAHCPADALPAADPNALTAEQVVDAIVAAGLPAPDPRDNTSRICQDAGCVQLITTDDFSVYQFPDAASATKWGSAFPSSYQNGTIFIRYTQDGSNPTNPAMIPEYNRILDQLQGGN